MPRITHKDVLDIIDNSGSKPCVVTQIGTKFFRPNGVWYARCYSKRIGYMEQWGNTEIESLQKLEKHVAIQGDIWPPVEHA